MRPHRPVSSGAARRVIGFVVLCASLLIGCRQEGGTGVRLDGSPRYPDDQGVATELSHEEITLDGKRTYEVSERLAAFSTVTATLEPMLNRAGQYVQVGLEGDTMVWMAGVGAIVELPQGPRVIYAGTLRSIDDDGRLVFRDGTVWELAPGVDPPKAGTSVRLEVDPAKHRVVRVAGP